MVFFETQIFTKRIRELISDDDYKEPQLLLVKYPDSDIRNWFSGVGINNNSGDDSINIYCTIFITVVL